MRIQVVTLLAGLVISQFAPVANAAAMKAKSPTINMSADQIRQISKNETLLKGNVVIRKGRTEIKARTARVTAKANKLIIQTDTVFATVQK
ncbi:LptA/OstA family protein [Brucella anthropi]|uniref:LptA/OstA family protein n=1 Tax=Brucella anthropi TaxID=529 RepID=UPI0023618BAC|nr:LptA/OstA family protein [Brucella anthropi]